VFDDVGLKYVSLKIGVNTFNMENTHGNIWNYSFDTLWKKENGYDLIYKIIISDYKHPAFYAHEDNIDVHPDLEGPIFIEDITEMAGSKGNELVFRINVTDNVDTECVWIEYWFSEGSTYRNESMEMESENIWIFEIKMNEDILFLHYFFHAFDIFDNWNSTMDLGINDTEEPLIFNITEIECIETGERCDIKFNVTDNIEVDGVYIRYWFGDDQEEIIQLEGSDCGYQYCFEIPMDSLEELHFYLSARDTTGNRGVTDERTVNVIDGVNPTISSIRDLTINEGESINITVDADDNIGIASIQWYGSPIPAHDRYLDGSVLQPGTFNITVLVTDSSGNNASCCFNLTVLPLEVEISEEEGSLLIPIIGIAAAVFVILIIVILAVYLYKRAKGKSDNDDVDGKEDGNEIDDIGNR
jgi:hypothetical protein